MQSLPIQTTVPGAVLLAAGAGKVDVSQLRGLSRWFVGLYNDHRVVYAVLTVAIVWTAGIVLGVGFEFVLGLMGRETERLDLNE